MAHWLIRSPARPCSDILHLHAVTTELLWLCKRVHVFVLSVLFNDPHVPTKHTYSRSPWQMAKQKLTNRTTSKDIFQCGNTNIYTLGFPSHPYHNQRKFYLDKQVKTAAFQPLHTIKFFSKQPSWPRVAKINKKKKISKSGFLPLALPAL